MRTFELSNGVKIPAIGYGTWKAPDSEITVEGIRPLFPADTAI